MLQRQLAALANTGDGFNHATGLLHLRRVHPGRIDGHAKMPSIAEILLTAQRADRRGGDAGTLTRIGAAELEVGAQTRRVLVFDGVNSIGDGGIFRIELLRPLIERQSLPPTARRLLDAREPAHRLGIFRHRQDQVAELGARFRGLAGPRHELGAQHAQALRAFLV